MRNMVTFTDNHRQANSFIKELYIGGTWSEKFAENHSDITVKMILYLARNDDAPTGPFISIGLNADFDGVDSIEHGFMIANNMSTSPIKMDSFGIFEGVDCYVVVDWNTPWNLPVELTDLADGEICFGAEIDMAAATNINNSPTIKTYVESLNYKTLPANLPDVSFTREVPSNMPIRLDTQTYHVSDSTEIMNAINHATADTRVVIELDGDILLSSTLEFNSSTNNIKINGNDHKIYEYHDPISCQASQHESDGYYHVPYTSSVITGNEMFMDSDGNQVHLRRTKSFSGCLVSGSQKIVPSEPIDFSLIDFSDDDPDNPIFVSFRVSYMRFKTKVFSFENGEVRLDFGDLDIVQINAFNFLSALYPYTHFYFENCKYNDDDECGVIIKSDTLLVPECYDELCKCNLQWLIMNQHSGSKVEINNTQFVGGLDASIKNFGILFVDNCHFSNINGEGIDTYCYAKITNSSFNDIMGCGVRQEFLSNPNYLEYMEVENCVFRNIGHYGTNTFAIWNTSKAYIANNEFVDTNYGAIRVGHDIMPSGRCLNTLPCNSLVIGNYIHYTEEWIEKRQTHGFGDSGDIYIACFNSSAIICYNKIFNCGGIQMNSAIYADEGAFNMKIFCNYIYGTENYYDIFARDIVQSPNECPTDPEVRAVVSTNNYIGYNYYDGVSKVQENTGVENPNCVFINNVNIKNGERNYSNHVNSIVNYESGSAITTLTAKAAQIVLNIARNASWGLNIDSEFNIF